MPPETHYAKSGEINIAYQVVGDGPLDLVFVPGFISHLDLQWADPRIARFLDRLASFSRLILFDKRGTGLSDPVAAPAPLEERMDDVRAVMDAAGSERAALFGLSEGGPMSVLFAATYPERTRALILCGTFATGTLDPDDNPAGQRWVDEYQRVLDLRRALGRGPHARGVRAERRQRARSHRARHLRALGRQSADDAHPARHGRRDRRPGRPAQHPRADARAPPRGGVRAGRARALPGGAHSRRAAGRAAGSGPHPLLRRRRRLRRGDRGVPRPAPATRPRPIACSRP